MNFLLWVFQIALACAFAAAGAIKLFQSRQRLEKAVGGWVDDVPAWSIKPLGLAELLAAVGLIAPPLVDVAPILAPTAAIGLGVTMLGAVAIHARRGEYSSVITNVVLLALAALVAWGRFGQYAF